MDFFQKKSFFSKPLAGKNIIRTFVGSKKRKQLVKLTLLLIKNHQKMKKLFTLLMILAIAGAGYAQVKQAAKKDFRPKAAQTRTVARDEAATMQNVQVEPSMMRVEGAQIEMTMYDWQSNCGARTWTHVWEDGKVNFCFTTAATSNYADRGTGIITYDPETQEFVSLGGRIEADRTGFGSIARYGENGLAIAAHTADELHLYIAEDKDNMTANSLQAVSVLDNTTGPAWPAVMTSGPNRDIIHVVATAGSGTLPGMDSVTDPIVYFRSMDGGQTWDKQNVVLPFMGPADGLDWGSNVCYFMETTEDNTLTLVVNNAWSDGFVLVSHDDGETWEKKMYYSHPNIHGVDTANWFLYPRWVSPVYDSYGNLKIAYEWNGSTGEAGSGSYYPGIGGVAYWAENLPCHDSVAGNSTIEGNLVPGEPFILDTAYLDFDIYQSSWWWSDRNHMQLPEYIGSLLPQAEEGYVSWDGSDESVMFDFYQEGNSTTNHGHYNNGVCAMPVLMRVPGSDDLVAVWTALDTRCKDGDLNYYYHLFANYSPDGGLTWDNEVCLVAGEDYWMYENSEMVYPQAAIVDGQLVVVAQVDEGCGTFVQSDESVGTDNFYTGFVFNLNDLWGDNVAVPEVSHNTKMAVSPNPATTQLNVTLNQNEEISIYTITGQLVQRMKGHVGLNTINVSTLNSGIYFINAGSDTQKFVVK